MDKFIKLGDSFVSSKDKKDDDFADRLSAKTTVYILVVFAILNMLTAYVGKPITCWAPKHFAGSHTKFTNSYCWVRNTYYLPWDEEVPQAGDDTERQWVTYYQWMPFILLFQAFMFYLPTFVWHTFNSKAGIDCDSILEAAHKCSIVKEAANHDKLLGMVTRQMRWFLYAPPGYKEKYCCKLTCPPKCCGSCCGIRLGNYLTLLFLFSKVLFIVNVVSQFFWLNRLLGFNFNLFGFRFLSGDWALDAHEWTATSYVAFPRVTLCDFDVRRLGNTHSYAVQCALPINLFNEKMYTFLWFWFVFVACVSVFSFIVWFIRFLARRDRVMFVKNYLKDSGMIESPADKRQAADFVTTYLKQDGVFILRLIAQNADGITAREVCEKLYDQYKDDGGDIMRAKREAEKADSSV